MFNNEDGSLKNPIYKIPTSGIGFNNEIKIGPVNPDEGFNTTYSVSPGMFVNAISYITFPGVRSNMYYINTMGMVFNAFNLTPLVPYPKSGYLAVTLQTVNGGGQVFYVHRLVAYQFCSPPSNFMDLIVNHADTNKYNNFANNLEWITVAANNQHARHMKNGGNSFVINGRPVVDANFVRYLCEQFVLGKSNTEIMNELGIDIDLPNHSLFRDIRGGYTWKLITSQYTFDISSKKHAYDNDEKDQIRQYILQGKSDIEVFAIMNDRPYVASQDRLTSRYKTIWSLRKGLRKKGHNV